MVFFRGIQPYTGSQGGGLKLSKTWVLRGGLKPVLDVYSLKLAQKCLKFVKTIKTLHLSQHKVS